MRKYSLVLLCLLLALLVAFACKKATTTEYNIDSSSCNGCGECIRICPNDAIYYDHNGKAAIDQTKCTKCANCVAICPNSAIY